MESAGIFYLERAQNSRDESIRITNYLLPRISIQRNDYWSNFCMNIINHSRMLQRTNHHLFRYQACIDIDSLVIPILIPIPTNLPVLCYFSRSIPSNTFHLIYLCSMVYTCIYTCFPAIFVGLPRMPIKPCSKNVNFIVVRSMNSSVRLLCAGFDSRPSNAFIFPSTRGASWSIIDLRGSDWKKRDRITGRSWSN